MKKIGTYATAMVVAVAVVFTVADSAWAKRSPKLERVEADSSAVLAASPSDRDIISRGGGVCDSPALCDGDVNGDGFVDPLDTGAILSRFGLDACEAGNCQYDVNCDGVIDPLDTGYILSRFGTCDAPPSCTTPGCSAGPPANDSCSDAIEAFLGDTSYNTDGATQDGPDDCDEFTGNSDIWFFYEVVNDGNLVISQCGTTDPEYDPSISVYSGTSCPVGASLACSDDDCGIGGGPGEVTLFDLSAGDILLIRVGGWNDGDFPESETGEGVLTIKDHGGPCCLGHDLPGCDFVEEGDAAEIEACVCKEPIGDSFCCLVVWDDFCAALVEVLGCGVCADNDACEDNIPIEDGLISFSTVLATTDGEDVPGQCDEGNGFILDNDIWYCYTSPCTGTATFSTCNDGDDGTGEADYDSRFAAYLGCDCPATNNNLAACNDDGPGCAGFSSIMEVPVTSGSDYLIRVGGWNGASGTGVIEVSCD